MDKNRRAFGKWGEEQAKNYLSNHGFTIIEQNFSCPIGEIDLICSDKSGTIIFVEVKSRRTLTYGFPMESVNKKKQSKYYKVSLYYIQSKKIFKKNFRFDIVEVFVDKEGRCKFNHISDAFQMELSKYNL